MQISVLAAKPPMIKINKQGDFYHLPATFNSRIFTTPYLFNYCLKFSTMYRYFFFVVLLLGHSNIYAHPGHGNIDFHSLWHYLLTPEHGLPVLVMLVLTLAGFYRYGKKAVPAKQKAQK